MLWETRFRYGALPCAFKIIPHSLPLGLNATTRRHQIILMMQAVLMLICFASGTKMSHSSISGSAAAEGKLCSKSWFLYWHWSTAHSSAHLRPLLQTSEVWKVEPSLVLFHHHECPFPCTDWQSSDCTICTWCSTGESALAITDSVFFICITCTLLGKKSCFHTNKYIVFRHANHKILPDKSFAMPSLVRNVPIHFFISINNMHPKQCIPPCLPLSFFRSVCSNSSLHVQVLQTSEILKFVFYYTSSYLQQMTTKQVWY